MHKIYIARGAAWSTSIHVSERAFLRHNINLIRTTLNFFQTRYQSTDTTPTPSVRQPQPPPTPPQPKSTPQTKPDWSATQYLKFSSERTRPIHDLISHIPLPTSQSETSKPLRIIDLGCGPGTSTALLYNTYPGARITGIDSSPDMLDTARKKLAHIDFIEQDLNNYSPTSSSFSTDSEERIDLFFSNAVFNWLNPTQRVAIWTKLLSSLAPGGILAFQVPDNADEPSHAAMEAVANEPGSVWRATLQTEIRRQFKDDHPAEGDGVGLGNRKMQSVGEIYDLFKPFCSAGNGNGNGKGNLDIWRTVYHHVLPDHAAIVEWVKGTGLRPFIDPLPEVEREAYLKRYREVLQEVYPTQKDGSVILRYPRLFVVAVKA